MLRWLRSPLAGERLRVHLRPASIGLARRGVVPRPSGEGARWFPVAAGISDGENPSEPWRAAVETLAAALRERRRLTRVDVVLSDHFVRYLLIPWSRGLVSDTERLGFSQLAFRDRYGNGADSWEICLDEPPAGQSSFACAADRALVSGLRDIVTSAGGQLRSVTPAMMYCIHRHRAALGAAQFCFAAAEPERISLAFYSGGGWQAVRSRRVDGSLPETLPALLKQEAAASDAPVGGTLYVCMDAAAGTSPVSVPGWQVIPLAPPGKSRRLASRRLAAAEGRAA